MTSPNRRPEDMRRVSVPDETIYDQPLGTFMYTGRNAYDAVSRIPAGAPIATDIETPGLDNIFTINCVTISWRRADGAIESVLLNPARDLMDHACVADAYQRAGAIILHNAPFDIPPLHHAGLMTQSAIAKVIDTLLLARFAYPDSFGPTGAKNLNALAVRHLSWQNHKGGLELAFKAAGYRTQQAGYENMDIDAPVYRRGAMADTTATLMLEPILREHAIRWTLDHPFTEHGARTQADAEAILWVQEQTHRIMLARSATGIAVDMDYLHRYAEQIDGDRRSAELVLAQAGLEGGSGKGAALVEYLDTRGELPPNWPRTPTKKLRATKADLDGLDHPLAAAQRHLATTDKVMGYLTKVTHQASITGRCHPQVQVLGASATGRMAYGSPELQQFPSDARAVLISDNPDADQGVQWTVDAKGERKPVLADPSTVQLWSIDWSQIEPVTMALMAKDHEFLAPFESGADLYEPLMRAAGIDRKTAKVVLLASMYGQGIAAMAAKIGHVPESAAQIKRQLFAAMPRCEVFMSNVEEIAAQYQIIVTAGGRILPVSEQGGAYRGVNYIIQGSAYDVLSASIIELDRRGLSDSIILGMHDELVIQGDEAMAREVEQVMLTPPPFLTRWAQRTPVLRTDRAPTGRVWASV